MSAGARQWRAATPPAAARPPPRRAAPLFWLPSPRRSFCARRASDKCQREKRKTINGDDLLWAMQTLGFQEYVEPLKQYLAKFRESEKQALAAAHGVKTSGVVHSTDNKEG